MKARTRKERESIFPLRTLIAHTDETFTEAVFHDMACVQKTIGAKSSNSVKCVVGSKEEVFIYNIKAPKKQLSPTIIIRKEFPGITSETETVDIKLYGTVVISAFDPNTEDFRSLTQKEIRNILENFSENSKQGE